MKRRIIRDISPSLKAALVFALASFATSGINYITTPIFTRLLTNEQYGTVSVYNAWYSIIRVFASMTLIFPGVLNVGLYEHRENRWRYLSSMLGLTTLATMVLSLLAAVFFRQAEALLSLPASLIPLMLLTCLTQPATTFWTCKQRYEYRYQITFFVSVGSAVLAQAVSVLAVVLCAKGGQDNLDEVRLWSAGIMNMAVGAVLFFLICKRGNGFVDIPLWKSTALVALPLIPHYLGSELLSSIDKIMIGQMVGQDKAGIYSLAAVLSSIGVLLWRAMNVMFAPFVNEKLGKRDFAAIRKNVRPLLEMAGIACVIASLAAPEILRLLATKEYLEGIYIIPAIAAGVFVHALYDVFSAVSFFHKKSLHIMAATVTAAVVNLVLNYIFISRFGYLAAGYTTLISNLVLVLMHYQNIRKIEKERIYDGKFTVLIIVLVICGCTACNLVYDRLILRYVLVAALLGLALLRGKAFLTALMNMRSE